MNWLYTTRCCYKQHTSQISFVAPFDANTKTKTSRHNALMIACKLFRFGFLFCFASNLCVDLSLLCRVFVELNSFNVSRAILCVFFSFISLTFASVYHVQHTYFTMDRTSLFTLITFFYNFLLHFQSCHDVISLSLSLSASLVNTFNTMSRNRKKKLMSAIKKIDSYFF